MGEKKTWENRGKTRKALDFTPHLYTEQGHYRMVYMAHNTLLTITTRLPFPVILSPSTTQCHTIVLAITVSEILSIDT